MFFVIKEEFDMVIINNYAVYKQINKLLSLLTF